MDCRSEQTRNHCRTPLENKAMTTEATVKNYNMEILGQEVKESRSMDGRSENKVHTAGLYNSNATYKLSNRWTSKPT
jgi:hypothetical protein